MKLCEYKKQKFIQLSLTKLSDHQMGVSVSNSQSLRKIEQNRQKRQQEMPYVPRKATKTTTQITDLVENKTYELNQKPKVKPRQSTLDTIDNQQTNPQNEGEVNLLDIQNTKNLRATKLKKTKNSSMMMETKPAIPNSNA